VRIARDYRRRPRIFTNMDLTDVDTDHADPPDVTGHGSRGSHDITETRITRISRMCEATRIECTSRMVTRHGWRGSNGKSMRHGSRGYDRF
jgi:hypothetical protein